MSERFSRTEKLIGTKAMERLSKAHAAVFGIGGVGGFAAEALARSGVGHITLVDSDRIELSNCNRQIIATEKTLGRYKTDVMLERILDINPDAKVDVHRCFYLPETADGFDFSEYSYVLDAVDTVTAKLEIITRAKEAGVPVISSMGAGNKLDPTALKVADIYDTKVCPLAKVMRRECRKRGIESLKVVYSDEKPAGFAENAGKEDEGAKNMHEGADGSGVRGMAVRRGGVPGSVAFVPSVAGLIMAGEVIQELAGVKDFC